MLAPVSHHQSYTQLQEGQDKDTERSPPVDIFPEHSEDDVIADLPKRRLERHARLSLAPEIKRQFTPDEKEEPPDIAQKVEYFVALVPYR